MNTAPITAEKLEKTCKIVAEASRRAGFTIEDVRRVGMELELLSDPIDRMSIAGMSAAEAGNKLRIAIFKAIISNNKKQLNKTAKRRIKKRYI